MNSKKTIYIKYGDCVKADDCVMLNGDVVTWHNEVRHLGNHFDNKLSDIIDSGNKCWNFKSNNVIGHHNRLRRHLPEMPHKWIGYIVQRYSTSSSMSLVQSQT